MKFVSVILVALAAVGPLNAFKIPSTGSGELAKDLQDFMDLVPFQEMIELSRVYLAQDRDFQVIMSFMRSDQMKQLIQNIEVAPEFKTIMDYVQNGGLDIYYLVNSMNKALGLAPVSPLMDSKYEIIGGIDGYVKEVGKLLPLNEMFDLYHVKRDSSVTFSDFVDKVSSNEFVHFYNSVANDENLRAIKQQIADAGIDTDNFGNYFLPLFVISFLM